MLFTINHFWIRNTACEVDVNIININVQCNEYANDEFNEYENDENNKYEYENNEYEYNKVAKYVMN